MNTITLISKQVRLVAAVAAMIATLCVTGGSLSLAEHYAQAGVADQAATDTMADGAMHVDRSNA